MSLKGDGFSLYIHVDTPIIEIAIRAEKALGRASI
jgi:hypothetical protein